MTIHDSENPTQTLISVVNHIISEHPEVAHQIEQLAHLAQGKGYGTASIQQENEVTHALLGKNPKLAMDIGGNVGEYSAEIRRRNPETEIHIFEPSAVNIRILRSRFASDKDIKIAPYAVAEVNGSATLYANEPGSGLGSLTPRNLGHIGIDFRFTESVSVIRFEDYWRNTLGGREIDIVKLDIEGHELSALKGFGEAIYFMNVIQFEFGGCNIDTRTYLRDFWHFFTAHRFDLCRITPTGLNRLKKYQESDEFFSTTNYVAVRT
jgi:FkbM family methyltransferase